MPRSSPCIDGESLLLAHLISSGETALPSPPMARLPAALAEDIKDGSGGAVVNVILVGAESQIIKCFDPQHSFLWLLS